MITRVAGCLALAAGSVFGATDYAAPGSLEVAIRDWRDAVDSTRGRPVPIKAHLPAGAGPHPLVIVSHGGGGHVDANFAQAQHLATHGYLVLALEHVGSNTEVLRRSGRLVANLEAMTRDANEVLARPRDVSFAIDEARRRLPTQADLTRIGALGHSFGAYTVLAVAGARPALDWLTPPVAPGQGLGPDLSDTRVRCGVALSPQGPGEPFFIEASYTTLRGPLLGITGSKDQQQRAKPENRRRGFALWPDGEKFFVWLANADHTAFSDATGAARRMLPSATRADVQPLVRAATLAFFDACLKRDGAARAVLSEAGLRPYLRGRIEAVEVLTR